eukprot:1043350-Rhodomonas_salina.1
MLAYVCTRLLHRVGADQHGCARPGRSSEPSAPTPHPRRSRRPCSSSQARSTCPRPLLSLARPTTSTFASIGAEHRAFDSS